MEGGEWSIQVEPRSDGFVMRASRGDEVRRGRLIGVEEIDAGKAVGRENELIQAASDELRAQLAD